VVGPLRVERFCTDQRRAQESAVDMHLPTVKSGIATDLARSAEGDGRAEKRRAAAYRGIQRDGIASAIRDRHRQRRECLTFTPAAWALPVTGAVMATS